jgi:hypothetical protein
MAAPLGWLPWAFADHLVTHSAMWKRFGFLNQSRGLFGKAIFKVLEVFVTLFESLDVFETTPYLDHG